MPQLDFIIAFPQIFWLVVIFFSLYTILVHFFLPTFIKLLKSRKQIVLENSQLLISLQKNFDLKQKNLNKLMEKNFLIIKEMLEKEIFNFFSGSFSINLVEVDKKIAKTLYCNLLYYDSNILEAISIKPKF